RVATTPVVEIPGRMAERLVLQILVWVQQAGGEDQRRRERKCDEENQDADPEHARAMAGEGASDADGRRPAASPRDRPWRPWLDWRHCLSGRHTRIRGSTMAMAMSAMM